MKEKNRRIAFLAHKCEALYRQRVLANASLQGVQNQWSHVLDEVRESIAALDASTSSEKWTKPLESLRTIGTVHVDPASITLHLPEWFIGISNDKEEGSAELPSSSESTMDSDQRITTSAELTEIEREVEAQGERKREETVELLQRLVAAVAQQGSKDDSAALQYAHIVQEKRDALDEAMKLKNQLDAVRTLSTVTCVDSRVVGYISVFWAVSLMLSLVMLRSVPAPTDDYGARPRIQRGGTAPSVPRL